MKSATDLTPARASQPGDSRPLAVLFVCGGDFRGPSEKQVAWFGRELIARNHSVMIAVHGDPQTALRERVNDALELNWYRFLGPRLRREALDRARAFRPDLIHLWNPRAATVRAAQAYLDATPAPMLLHWEDDEWGQLGGLKGGSRRERVTRALRQRLAWLKPPIWNLSTERSVAWATDAAAAFDALTPELAREVERRTGRRCATLLPAAPPEVWSAAAQAPTLPASFEQSEILLYTGDINFGRVDDIQLGLSAIAEVQRRGWPVMFVHAGRQSAGDGIERMASRAGMAPGTALTLGDQPFARIPALLCQASILLQPGRPTDFNRLCLPSKLQSYLASGTPCITFAVGAGELLEDRLEVVKTYTGEPSELAEAIVELLRDTDLRHTLALNGPRAARRLFDPARNTDALVAHYRASIDSHSMATARPGLSPHPHP